MYDNDYAFLIIERNRREELERKLDRMAKSNAYSKEKKSGLRNIERASVVLLGLRDFFMK